MSGTVSKMPHEDFNVKREEKKEGRRLVIRPDRIRFDDERCRLEVNGEKSYVVDVSPFGLAVETEKPLELKKDTVEGTLLYDYVDVSNLKLKKIRKIKISNSKLQYAFEVVGEPLNMERLIAVKDSMLTIANVNEELKKSVHLPQEFKNIVYEIKDWLENLNQKLDQLDKYNNQSEALNDDFSHTVVQVISNFLIKEFQPLYEKLKSESQGYDQDTLVACFEFFRNKLKDLLYKAPYANRGYNKPLGYAGDFMMMDQIYNYDKFIGDSLFSKCMQRYFVDVPAAKAVRNRCEYLKTQISDKIVSSKNEPEITILSVAAGPARELQRLIEEDRFKDYDNLEFEILDQDMEALKFSQRKLRELQMAHGTSYNFNFTNLAIKNIIENGIPDKKYDLIYTAGLFDYLSAPVAKLAILQLFKSLKDGGKLIVGNFSFSNPDQFGMELALDWKLIYRSEKDMKNIFSLVDRELNIDAETLGINLFASVIK